MESFITIISQVGFPIAVATYVLVRMEQRMEDLKKEILSLKETIVGKDGILDKIEDLQK